MAYLIKDVTWQEHKSQLKQIRERVFVCEYHIPKTIEFDRSDNEAFHVIVSVDSNTDEPVVATGRLSKDGLISRVAVLASHRNQELYLTLFSHFAEIAKLQGLNMLSFNCRLTELEKFTCVGYKPEGCVFMEAGIARQRLCCPVNAFNPQPFTMVH
jgi:predicted GNAT family N-acyltransferase